MFQEELKLLKLFPNEVINAILTLDPKKRFKSHRLRQLKQISESGNKAYYEVKAATGENFFLKKVSKLNNVMDILNTIAEIQTLLANQQLNICECYGYDYAFIEGGYYKEHKTCFITFYLLLDHGETLENMVRLTPRCVNNQFVKEMISSILSACFFLNKKNIAHEAINPDNIILVNNNKFKLFGFEGSFIGKSDKGIALRTIKGIPEYMAPEIYREYKVGIKETDHDRFVSDVFSLGLTFMRVALAKPIKEINDIENIEIPYVHDQNLQKIVSKFNDHALARLLDTMLILDETKRPNFIELVQYLTEEGEYLEGYDFETSNNNFSFEEEVKSTARKNEIHQIKRNLSNTYDEIQLLSNRLRDFDLKEDSNNFSTTKSKDKSYEYSGRGLNRKEQSIDNHTKFIKSNEKIIAKNEAHAMTSFVNEASETAGIKDTKKVIWDYQELIDALSMKAKYIKISFPYDAINEYIHDFCHALDNADFLSGLEMINTNSNDETIFVISSMLKSHKNLKELIMSFNEGKNKVTNKGIKALAEPIELMSQLKVLGLHFYGQIDLIIPTNLPGKVVGLNSITNEGIEFITKAFKKLSDLRMLTLDFGEAKNAVDDYGLEIISKRLPLLKSMEELTITITNSGSKSRNHITEKGIKCLLDALMDLENLLSLNLNFSGKGNSIKKEFLESPLIFLIEEKNIEINIILDETA